MTGKMRLLCSAPSAFSRKVRLAAAALDLTGRLEIVTTRPEPDRARLSGVNPLGKIPVLMDGDFICYDSPLICRYLDEVHGPGRIIPTDATRYPSLQREALADGLIEAGMLYRAERIRPEGGLDSMAQVQRGKVTGALAQMDAQIGDCAGRWTVGEMAMVSAIGWLEFRLAGEEFLAGLPALDAWYRHVSTRPDVQATRPDL